MGGDLLDRGRLAFLPLGARKNKVSAARDLIPPDAKPYPLPPEAASLIEEAAERIRRARERGRPVICAFGAHSIKNGLGPVLSALVEEGWITHLATNGAGIIHDWELSFLGSTSEDVRANVGEGRFGTWEETGRFLNLALRVGAYRGLGYGESVGAFIGEQGLTIPDAGELRDAARAAAQAGADRDAMDRGAAALDLLEACIRFSLPAGRMDVAHPFRASSLQARARAAGVPFTGHPMIGHDIIYVHPMNGGAAVGRTAERDFLRFASAVSRLDGGVYLSVGSAVMSPMIFEKSLSMAQNLAVQEGRRIRDHFILVVDLAKSQWDWTRDGEPPMSDPAYYLRYCKTFSRMGGTMRYLSADNRDFFLMLLTVLRGKGNAT
jgi:hypothetical protein